MINTNKSYQTEREKKVIFLNIGTTVLQSSILRTLDDPVLLSRLE